MASSKPLLPPEPSELHGAGRNEGVPFDAAWLASVQVDEDSVERRAAAIPSNEEVDPARRAESLLKTVTLLDLTTLADDDTAKQVSDVCAAARSPIHRSVLAALGLPPAGLRVAAVCVHDRFVAAAVAALAGSAIPVAAVTAGFPKGVGPLPSRLAEVSATVAAGADEIDVVIRREHVLAGDWRALYDEVSAFRGACGPARLKTILETGALGPLDNVAKASLVCGMAGADFIKTSTGRERTHATLPVGLTMVDTIRTYAVRAGYAIGLKPAGGIRQAEEALVWLRMMREQLGSAWVTPAHFRIGASSLLADIEHQLEVHVAEAKSG